LETARDRSVRASAVDHELIWAPIATLILLAARFFPFEQFPIGWCPLLTVTGVPCLSCGGTRALMALTRLDLAAAFALNPLIAALGLAGVAYVVHALGVWLLGWRRWRPAMPSASARRALRIAVVVAIAINWGYLIVVGR